MRLYWFILIGFSLSCELLTTANPEYCESTSDCVVNYSCHPVLHRCETGPIITNIEPASGPSSGNIDIKITGLNFRPGTTVAIGGQTAAITSIADGELHVMLPPSPGTCGAAAVKVRAPDGVEAQESSLFRYKYAQVQFTPVANPPIVDTNARSILAGRVDGDGINDLIVANSTSTTLSVFRGVGDLRFMSMAAVSSVVPPTNANIADFDGDGANDLLVSGTGNFVLFQGRNDSTFNQKSQYVYNLKNIAVADINNDTRPDLITLSSVQNNIDLFTNQGSFSFTPEPITTLAGPSSALVVADDFANSVVGLLSLHERGRARDITQVSRKS